MKSPEEILNGFKTKFVDADDLPLYSKKDVVNLMNEYADQFRNPPKKTIEEITDRCQKEFHPILMNWLSYKAQKNQKYKPIGLKTLVKKFNQFTGTSLELESIVEASIMNNYAGIVWPKNNTYGKSTKPTRIDVHQSEFERQFGRSGESGTSGDSVIEDAGATVIN